MWRLKWSCRPCRHWIQGSTLWDMRCGRPEPDVEYERTLEYALAFDLLLGNACFKKLDSHLITYKSGNRATQIDFILFLAFDLLLGNTCHLIMYKSGNIAMQTDFILFHRTMRKLVTDVKVIPGEEVALQHQLLVCDMRTDVPQKSNGQFTPHLKVWKLKDPQMSNHF